MRFLTTATFILLLVLASCNRPSGDKTALSGGNPPPPPIAGASTNAAQVALTTTTKSPVIISDTFEENANADPYHNMAIEGVKPAPVDVPGSAWQLAAGDGPYETYLTAPGSLGLIGVFHNTASTGLSLASNSAYVKPTTFTVSADICFDGDPTVGYGLLGFYSALSGPHTGNTLANYTGLALYEDGSLHLIEKGADTAQVVKFWGTYDPAQPTTLRYTVDSEKGTISNVSLSGSSGAYDFKSSAFTNAATAYVGVGGTTGGQTVTLITNLIVASGVYVPPPPPPPPMSTPDSPETNTP
jgi:hypothetical protein